MDFHYYTGEVVAVGDLVRTGGGRSGIVEEIIQPGLKAAEWYDCSDGGVRIIEDWNGVFSPLLMTPPDGKYWEDLELIKRKDA
jgi:hypothetical protein